MMSQADTRNTVKRLDVAVSERMLDGDILSVGERLLDHLQQPVQITATGRPGSGKSSLIRMLLGGALAPTLEHVSILELHWGDKESAEFELWDGTRGVLEGCVRETDLPGQTFRVIQKLPIPALKGRILADVTWPEEVAARTRLLDWLVETTNITIWCSEDFNEAERACWARFPDSVKDHSYLALTKADQLQMKGTLAAQTARFQEQDCEDFLALYPIASKQAIAAHRDGLIDNAELWTASGGQALHDGLAHQIDVARRADLDYADMLLARLPEIVIDETSDDPAPFSPAENRSATGPMSRTEAVETALTLLQDCAEEMSKAPTPDPKDVLAQSAQTAQALATLFMDAGAEDAQVNALRDDVLESEQVIMLLQLEDTTSAAHDAVGALLQLKKEMSEVAHA